MKKIQKKFYLLPDVAEAIKEQAEKQGVSESVYVQQAMKLKTDRDKKNETIR